MLQQKLVLATSNKGKLAEIRKIFGDDAYTIIAQSEYNLEPVAETGTTFLANALLKAEQATKATGLIAIADDSGLAVDALDGAPGVHSARYAADNASDVQNVDKLLAALRHIDGAGRGASFHCVAVAVFPDASSEPLIARGEWRGQIASARHGSEGFGYDPVFFDLDLTKCAAEMTRAEKNARSHRGQAFRQLAELLAAAPRK